MGRWGVVGETTAPSVMTLKLGQGHTSYNCCIQFQGSTYLMSTTIIDIIFKGFKVLAKIVVVFKQQLKTHTPMLSHELIKATLIPHSETKVEMLIIFQKHSESLNVI